MSLEALIHGVLGECADRTIPRTIDPKSNVRTPAITAQCSAQPAQCKTPPEPSPDKVGNHWRITLQTGRVIEVCQTPPQTRSWVITNWQALDAIMLPDIPMILE